MSGAVHAGPEGQLDPLLADPLRTTAKLGAVQTRENMIEALGTRGWLFGLGAQRNWLTSRMRDEQKGWCPR